MTGVKVIKLIEGEFKEIDTKTVDSGLGVPGVCKICRS